MHSAGNPVADLGVKGLRLGVFQVVRDFMEECFEELAEGAAAVAGVVGVDPDQPARSVVAAEDVGRRTGVNVQFKLDPASVDPIQPLEEERGDH